MSIFGRNRVEAPAPTIEKELDNEVESDAEKREYGNDISFHYSIKGRKDLDRPGEERIVKMVVDFAEPSGHSYNEELGIFNINFRNRKYEAGEDVQDKAEEEAHDIAEQFSSDIHLGTSEVASGVEVVEVNEETDR